MVLLRREDKGGRESIGPLVHRHQMNSETHSHQDHPHSNITSLAQYANFRNESTTRTSPVARRRHRSEDAVASEFIHVSPGHARKMNRTPSSKLTSYSRKVVGIICASRKSNSVIVIVAIPLLRNARCLYFFRCSSIELLMPYHTLY